MSVSAPVNLKNVKLINPYIKLMLKILKNRLIYSWIMSAIVQAKSKRPSGI